MRSFSQQWLTLEQDARLMAVFGRAERTEGSFLYCRKRWRCGLRLRDPEPSRASVVGCSRKRTGCRMRSQGARWPRNQPARPVESARPLRLCSSLCFCNRHISPGFAKPRWWERADASKMFRFVVELILEEIRKSAFGKLHCGDDGFYQRPEWVVTTIPFSLLLILELPRRFAADRLAVAS